MKCPKCQHEQPSGRTECEKCGVVFAKWRGDSDASGYAPSNEPYYPPAAQTQAAAPAGGGALRPLGMIVGLLAACAGWYWFLFWAPGGLPVQADAYRDAENGFALVAPQGWQATKTRDCKNVGTALSGASACAVLDLSGAGASTATVQVITVPVGALFETGWGGSVRIAQSDASTLAKSLEDGMAKAIPGYTRESAEVVTVDRIASLRVIGSATFTGTPTMIGDKMVTIPDFSGRQTEHHLTTGTVLVPGGKQAFLVTYGCESAQREVTGAAFDAIVSSFRLTDGRPTPFQSYGGVRGSIKGDAILGGLVGLSLGVLKMLIGSR